MDEKATKPGEKCTDGKPTKPLEKCMDEECNIDITIDDDMMETETGRQKKKETEIGKGKLMNIFSASQYMNTSYINILCKHVI